MIKVTDLIKVYKPKTKNYPETHAINGMTFTLPDKGLVFIVGKSGSGKSTLLNILGGLDDYDSGSVIVDGNDLKQMKHKDFNKYRSTYVSFIFQDHFLIDDFKVKDNVNLSLNIINESNYNLVNDTLKKVDVIGKDNNLPSELSGGERQRVAVARAIIKDPKLILCDEPTGNLDSKTTLLIFDLLKELSKNRLVVVVSHDMDNAYNYADRIIEIFDGKILSDKVKNAYYSDKLSILNDVISIPDGRVLNNKDIDYINSKINNETKLELSNKQYIDNDKIDDSNRKIKLIKKPFYKKGLKHISKVFISKRIKKMFITSLIISIIISCFLIFLSLLSFNGDKELLKKLKKDKVSELAIRRNLYINNDPMETIRFQNKLCIIDDSDIDYLKEMGYKGNIYKIYNYGISSSASQLLRNESMLIANTNLSKFYIKDSYGTLTCDKSYLDNKFSSLEVIKGDILDKGIIITDYTADSMIYNNMYVDSYDDIIGKYYCSSATTDYIYVSAIIKTDYKERFKNIIDKCDFTNKKTLDITKFLNDDEFGSFASDVQLKYGLCYSFSKDFISDVVNSEKVGWIPIRYSHIEMNNTTYYLGQNVSIQRAKTDYGLNSGEVVANLRYFNEIFGTNYTTDNMDTFTPTKIKIKKYYDYSNIANSKVYSEVEVTIKKLVEDNSANILFCLETDYSLFKDISYINYSLMLDNLDGAIKTIDAFGKDYYIDDTNIRAVNLIAKYVLVFRKISILLSFILSVLCIIYLVFYEVSNVKANKKEIGIFKACGMAQRNIGMVFVFQQTIVCIMVIIISFILSYFLIKFSDTLMITSIKKYAEVYINGLTVIKFDIFTMISILLFMIFLIMTSCLIPIFMLVKVKPMSIIKAKE